MGRRWLARAIATAAIATAAVLPFCQLCGSRSAATHELLCTCCLSCSDATLRVFDAVVCNCWGSLHCEGCPGVIVTLIPRLENLAIGAIIRTLSFGLHFAIFNGHVGGLKKTPLQFASFGIPCKVRWGYLLVLRNIITKSWSIGSASESDSLITPRGNTDMFHFNAVNQYFADC